MQSFIEILSDSKLLSAISNAIAFITALYFLRRWTKFSINLFKSIHQGRVKPFIRNFLLNRCYTIMIAAKDIHFYASYCLTKICLVILSGIGISTGLIGQILDKIPDNKHQTTKISSFLLNNFGVDVKLLTHKFDIFGITMMMLIFTFSISDVFITSQSVQRIRRRKLFRIHKHLLHQKIDK